MKLPNNFNVRFIQRVLLMLVLPFAIYSCSEDDTTDPDTGGGDYDAVEIVEISTDVYFILTGSENIIAGTAIDSNASLEFEYINGYGREARVSISEEHGWIEADITETLASGADQTTFEIPLQGTPSEAGETELSITIMIDGSTVASKRYTITILDEDGTIPTLVFEDIQTSTEFVKGVAVAEGSSLSIDYSNAMGQNVSVALSGLSGISASTTSFILNSGSGTLTIPIEGTPESAGETTLTATITPDDGSEAVTASATITVGVENPITFDAPTTEGTIYQGTTISGYSLTLNYTNGLGRVVTPSFTIDAASGITVAVESSPITLEQESGTIPLVVSGDSPAVGTHECVASFSYDGDGSPVTTTIYISVSARADVVYNIDDAYISGTPLVLNSATDSSLTSLVLGYTNGWGRDVKISVSGQATSDEATYTLADSNELNYLSIPLSGTPEATLSKLNITIDGTESSISCYAGEAISHNGLAYYTVFVDLNSNGVVDSSEQWFDRNLGATSNDPGTYGNYCQNPDAVGDYYHYGGSEPVETVSVTKDGNEYLFAKYTEGYTYPADLTWSICPEGYRMPTREEFGLLTDKYLGTGYYTNTPDNIYGTQPYADSSKGSGPLLSAPLRISMGGLMIATASESHNDVPGSCGAYWSSSLVDDNTQPIRIFFQGDQSDFGKTTELRANIRCIKAD